MKIPKDQVCNTRESYPDQCARLIICPNMATIMVPKESTGDYDLYLCADCYKSLREKGTPFIDREFYSR